ncbi:MAG: hypothetical protein GXO22_01490 [Aquificae bacterium]|nr:hypothetical protein [Aquificota bacterium]
MIKNLILSFLLISSLSFALEPDKKAHSTLLGITKGNIKQYFPTITVVKLFPQIYTFTFNKLAIKKEYGTVANLIGTLYEDTAEKFIEDAKDSCLVFKYHAVSNYSVELQSFEDKLILKFTADIICAE